MPDPAYAYLTGRLDLEETGRTDARLAASLSEDDAAVVLFAGDRIVRDAAHGARVWREARAGGADLVEAGPILLGERDGRPVLAVRLKADVAGIGEDETASIRDVMMGPQDGLLAHAASLLTWHAANPFCARCGGRSVSRDAGYRRVCAACETSVFPRCDPVAIMMVTKGEHCLLGRQPAFPPGLYSCLAGFIEPGETVEHAVRREVREEAGVRVGRVDYRMSQPWPMPHSIMMGCRAEAETETIVRDEAELEDARWFDQTEVRAMMDGTHAGGLVAARQGTIARALTDEWLEGT